jgi:hypothetical protein
MATRIVPRSVLALSTREDSIPQLSNAFYTAIHILRLICCFLVFFL